MLAICSSLLNFAVSYIIQPFIDASSYGWAFTFFGILVILSTLLAIPMIIWGKEWRAKSKGRYDRFMAEKSQ